MIPGFGGLNVDGHLLERRIIAVPDVYIMMACRGIIRNFPTEVGDNQSDCVPSGNV